MVKSLPCIYTHRYMQYHNSLMWVWTHWMCPITNTTLFPSWQIYFTPSLSNHIVYISLVISVLFTLLKHAVGWYTEWGTKEEKGELCTFMKCQPTWSYIPCSVLSCSRQQFLCSVIDLESHGTTISVCTQQILIQPALYLPFSVTIWLVLMDKCRRRRQLGKSKLHPW